MSKLFALAYKACSHKESHGKSTTSTILGNCCDYIQSFDQGMEIKGMDIQKTTQNCVSKTI